MKPLIYLASRSPRRKGILGRMRIPYRVVSSSYVERKSRTQDPLRIVKRHALGKARRAQVPQKARFILGADTLVFANGHILEKPRDCDEAWKMINRLNGKNHRVYTGLALIDLKKKKEYVAVEETRVFFNKWSQAQLKNYLKKINPLDKAGSYAIQKRPFIVKKIEGSYSNVVGLPVERLREMLKSAMQTEE